MIRINAVVLAIAAAAGLTACPQGGVDPADGPLPITQPPEEMQTPEQVGATPAEADRRPIVTVSDTDPRHLVDTAGQALYALAGNDDGSQCDAACEDAWPPVLAEDGQPLAGPGGMETRLGSMPRDDGGTHVTYHDQPLYRYAADSGVGATAGHGVEDQWGTWSLVSPEGPPVPH